jgi:hypothetical protein
MTEPLLTKHDRLSAVWQKLQPHLEGELTRLRARNDKRLPHDQTEFLRGHIAAVKKLLSLGTDKPEDLLKELDVFED